eukprot:3794624-Prymnesium_polylepis.1
MMNSIGVVDGVVDECNASEALILIAESCGRRRFRQSRNAADCGPQAFCWTTPPLTVAISSE